MDQPSEDEALRAFGLQGFGKQTRETNVQAQIEQSRRKPQKTLVQYGPDSDDESHKSHKSRDSDNDDDDDDDDEDEEEEDEFPVSHELVLKTHEAAVTAMTMDASGTRLITGSIDCTLKFHDIPSMTATSLRSFKSVDPNETKGATIGETHPINQVTFNPISPSQVLVISASNPQAKIFNREGELQTQFVKGDMYLRDMHNTKGHVSAITSGAWHPTDYSYCVTAGTDSTLRIWDVTNKRAQKEVIVHKSRAEGSAGRTRMTAVAWGAPAQGGSNILVSAALDGSLVMWSGEGPYSRPTGEIRDAHTRDTWTSGIDVSADGRLVVTRGGDNTIKLWDTRKFKDPVSTTSHASTSSQFPTSNIKFSPNSMNIITGSETGDLHILSTARLTPELITPVTPGSPLISVLWHPKLNQIVTGSANAETHILYNPSISTGGAIYVMSRAPKKRHVDDDPTRTMDLSNGVDPSTIIVPGSLPRGTSLTAKHPTLGTTASGRSRDPRRPHLPLTTPFAKSQPDEKHIREHIPLSSMRDEDPRAALLKYADKAKNDPMFTNAWKDTQPKTIYAELSDEEEGSDDEPAKKKAKT
ncbi:WD repeat protein [Rhizodiscina lignyota]|uniref:WD repeat protein n=1 Tax=Rhizodiscina lignyota TaxID=1504668 RepID=A0A9P4I2R7_9PEZI|nr:WD repeat protein [Rhizodiscina lignyota]